MPLITNKIKISDGHILIWHLTESVDELRSRLANDLDFTEYDRISHPQKKREWLAGRLLFDSLCRLEGIPFQGIWKNPEGKPFLLGSSAHISLTHSDDLVVAALSASAPIGIDLERPREQLLRIAPKFLSPVERDAVNENILQLCLYWCAKEAIYKLFGGKKISLRESIAISPTPAPSVWKAAVTTLEINEQAIIRIEPIDNYYLAIAHKYK